MLRGLPALWHLEQSLRRCKPHKAAGPDRIPPELCRYAAKWLGHCLAPLFLKCQLYCTEPVHWKGGTLFQIWKHKGPLTQPESYRGILVSSHLSKALHNAFRSPTLEWHAKTADSLQYGGLPHRGVDMATHTLRSFLGLAQRHHRSCAVFFLDVKSAYYRLLRSLAVGPTCSHEELAQVISTMGLPPDILEDLWQATTAPSALSATGCPKWLEKYGTAFHQHTWFILKNSKAVTETLRGTRPGDGFADLLFNLVAGKILRELEEMLYLEGVQTTLHWNGRFGFEADAGTDATTTGLNVVWADDIAVMVHHDNAADLLELAETSIRLYIERLAAHGLILNFDEGKSELLLLLRGSGSRALRRDLFGQPDPAIVVTPKGFNPTKVRLIDKYKHLGNILHANGHLLSELRVRIGAANSAFQQHRRAVYHNRHLSDANRLQIFQACVLSVAYWNCATWTPLRPSEERYYFGALKRLIRRFLLPKFTLDEMLTWTDQRTFMEAGLLPPKLHIRLCRLGYFATLIRHGPAPLWALLATDRLWLDQILVDMPWFTTHCHSRVYRPPFLSSDGPVYWEHLIKEHNGTWKGLLKKARQHAFLQSKIHTRADLFERKIAAILADYNPMLAPRDPAASLCPDAPQPTVCIPCKRSFVSKAAWAIHAFKVHGRRAAARYIADQCSCDICHHSFLNEHRLYLHLRYSKPCFDALRARGVQINPLPGRGSREWNQATQFTLCPYQQAQGPDPDPGHLPAWDKIALAPHECDLLENLILLETLDFEPYLQPSTDETTWSAIRDCLQQAPVSLEEMRIVLLTWRSFLRAQQRPGQRLVPMNTHCWIRGINTALDRLTYSWLCPDIVYNHSQPVLTSTGLQQLEAIDLQACAAVAAPSHGPATTQPVFLHFFSGRRREGDLQQAIEALRWGGAWDPIVVSLDVVLDSTYGDLLNPWVQDYWMGLILRGRIDGILMGPPCESWTVSRERWYQDHCGPPPIRHLDHLWGLDKLFVKEGSQILVGNGLLQYCGLAYMAQWRQGRCAILEHPAEPSATAHPTAPSIWRLRAFRLIAALPRSNRERLFQGFYEAKSPKPTDLLCAHCPEPLSTLADPMRTRQRLPPALRMGKTTEGRYETYELKEYPGPFNKMLAATFHWWWCNSAGLQALDLTPEELQIVHRLHSFIGQGTIGPDYAC